MSQPEKRVEPEREPCPPFGSPVRHDRDQTAEKPEPDRSEPIRAIHLLVMTHWNEGDDHTEDKDSEADDGQADPADPQPQNPCTQ
jgi:hypothetical protein